jgi:hypothetical protein
MPITLTATGEPQLPDERSKTKEQVVSPPHHQIELVERASAATLPTEIVTMLSQLGLGDRDLIKATALANSALATPPRWIFGGTDPKEYRDPISGEHLSLREAQRFSDSFAPVAIATMLSDAADQPSVLVQARHGDTSIEVPVPVKRIGALALAIARAWGEEIPADIGIAMATSLARRGVKPADFARNIDAVARFVRYANFGPQGARQLQTIVALTLAATEDGRVLTSIKDVQEALVGPEAMATAAKLREYLDKAQSEPETDSSLPGYARTSFQVTPTSEQYARAADNLKLDMPPEVWAVAAPDLAAEIRDFQSRIKLEEQAFQRSLPGKALSAIDRVFDESAKFGFKLVNTAVLVIHQAVIAPVQGVLPGGGDSVASQWEEGHRMWLKIDAGLEESHRKFGTPSFAYAAGITGTWASLGTDLFLAWFTDPLVILGKGKRLLNLGRAYPGLTDKASATSNMLARAAAHSKTLTSLANRYNDWRVTSWTQRAEAFTKDKFITDLFKVIRDDAAYKAKTIGLRTVYEAGGLDPIYMSELRRAILETYPDLGPRALEEFRTGIKAHIVGGWAPEGSIANVVIARRIQAGEEAERALLRLDELSLQGAPLETILQESGDFGGALGDALRELLQADREAHLPRLEVPTPARPVPGLGLRRFVASRTERAGGLRSELTLNPGRVINFEADPVEYVRLNSNLAGLPPEKVAELQSDMAAAASAGVAREDRMRAVVETMNDSIYDHTLRRLLPDYERLDEAVKADMYEAVMKPYREMNRPRQAFDVIPPELDETIPKALDDLTVKQRGQVYRHVKKMRQDSMAWKALSKAEQDELEKQLRAWVRGAQRPDQMTWAIRWEAKKLLEDHLESLAALEDRIRRIVGHPTLSAAERWGELHDTLGFDYYRRIAYAVGGNDLYKIIEAGEDIDQLVADIVRLDPEGGILLAALRDPETVPWASRGITATIAGELEDALPPALYKEVIGEATTTRELIAAVKRALRFSDPWPLHPEDIAARMGVNIETSDELRAALGRTEVRITRRPSHTGQLQNTMMVPDPRDIAARLKGYIGLSKRLARQLTRQLPELDGVTRSRLDATIQKTVLGAKDIHRAYRRTWKVGAVARPAYVPKVILLDENSRFLSQWGLTQRVLAHRWGPFGRLLDRTGIYDTVIRAPDGSEVARIGRAGSERFGYEPLATSKLRQMEVLDETMRESRKVRRAFRPSGGEDKVLPSNPGHTVAWVDTLNRELASAPGTIALEAVSAGKTYEETKDALIAWAKREGRQTFTRIGYRLDEMDEWAATLAGSVHYYTLGSKEVARLVLARIDPTRLGKHLERLVPSAQRPIVIGPVLQAATSEGIATKAANGLFRWFVQKPEDVLNRQPFFRQWKRAAMVSYYDAVGRSGLTVTEQTKRAIDVAATRFALDQVRRVMFDATRQQRVLEQMGIVFPFPQPFFEGYTAWGHLALVREPATIPHVRQLFLAARDAGIIRQDENGEFYIPWHPLQYAAHLAGFLPKDSILRMRLSSLSILASSQIDVEGVTIPVPGPDPLVMRGLQEVFADSTNDAAISFLFQFGPETPIVPFPIEAAARVISPEQFGEEELERLTLGMMRDLQYKGLVYDEDGLPLPYAEIERIARHEAEQLLISRALAGIIGPASPSIRWGYQPLLDELRQMRDEMGFQEGTQAFNEKYDYAYTLLTIGTTESLESFEGREVPRIPPSEFVAKLRQQPGVQEFLAQYPAWFGLLLEGLDPELVNEFSAPFYAREVERGVIKPKDPAEFWSEGEAAKAWPHWIEFRDSVLNPLYEAWQRQGGDYESYKYAKYVTARQEELTHMAMLYPTWASQYLRELPDHPGTFDWAHDTPDTTPPTLIVDQARMLVADPRYRSLPGVQAVKFYLTERDKIAAEMEANGYTDITNPNAEDLKRRYDRLMEEGAERWPEAWPLVASYFGGDLMDFQGRRIEAYQGKGGEAILRFDTRWRQLRRAQGNYDFEFQFFGKLQETQSWLNGEWFANRKTVTRWFETEYPPGSPQYRRYMLDLATKPPEFMSAFELHLMGLNVGKTAAAYIEAVAAARNEIAKAEHKDPLISESALYEQLDAQVKVWAAQNKNFAAWVNASNRWGWGLKATGLTEQEGKTGDAWSAIFQALGEIQAFADKFELTGTNDFDPKKALVYGDLRKQLMDQINLLFLRDPDHKRFRHQWETLQDLTGGSLIQTLMPDSYFKLGSVSKDG